MFRSDGWGRLSPGRSPQRQCQPRCHPQRDQLRYPPRGLFAVLASLLLCGQAFANSDFEFFMREREQGVAQIESEFRTYVDQQDEAFAGFLKGQWSQFQASQGAPRMLAPEPSQAPRYTPVDAPKTTPQPHPKPDPKPATIPSPPAGAPKPKPDVPVPQGPAVPQRLNDPQAEAAKPSPGGSRLQAPVPSTPDELTLTFYGNVLRIPYDVRWRTCATPTDDKPAAMAAFWTRMSASRHEATLQAMAQARQRLALDDWATLNAWRELAVALCPGETAEQTLLLWFFLVKSGFDVRMAYSGDILYLLVAVERPVYESPRVVLAGRTYYPLLADRFGVGMRQFHTYEADYPGKLRAVNLNSVGVAFATVDRATRTLSFEYNDKPVTLSAPYNAAVIPYLNRVPPLDFSVYFSSQASDPIRQEWLPELKRRTAGLSQTQAVEFLLTLVQFSLEYKTTLEQFGRDKAFFVDDALYFPYSDCKARAVLFAWLVRNVVGVQVVGLHYPNHLTIAVALKDNRADWVTINHKGERYVYADPTYVGAPVGRQQREYRGVAPIAVIEMH